MWIILKATAASIISNIPLQYAGGANPGWMNHPLQPILAGSPSIGPITNARAGASPSRSFKRFQVTLCECEPDLGAVFKRR